eukprot:472005_1
MSALLLNHNTSQRTLIGGECDFSFTSSIIQKRKGGTNCCSTTWCYYNQWIKNITKEIGISKFNVFRQNLRFCQKNNCNVIFGIDGRCIASTQPQWNDKLHSKFDRIIYTFPRVYKWTETIDITDYNQQNETLMFNLLNAARTCLTNDGEIHVMLFKDQFFKWKIKQSLNKLNMILSHWYDLTENPIALNTIFPGYTPRDTFGNYMKLIHNNGNPLTIYMCCFRNKHNLHLDKPNMIQKPNITVLCTVYYDAMKIKHNYNKEKEKETKKNCRDFTNQPRFHKPNNTDNNGIIINQDELQTHIIGDKSNDIMKIKHKKENEQESKKMCRAFSPQQCEHPWHLPPRFHKQKKQRINDMDNKCKNSAGNNGNIINQDKPQTHIIVENNSKKLKKRRKRKKRKRKKDTNIRVNGTDLDKNLKNPHKRRPPPPNRPPPPIPSNI